jgi:4-carboxymuconolactone decarboxylase
MTDDRLERGQRIRREVLGDDHVDRSIARTTDFTRPFQDYVTANVWPEIWGRPGLDRRTRSAVTLAVLTALRAESEIPMHVRAALRNGLTPAEISEVLLHVAAYAGVPAANRAFELANAVLAGEEAPDPVESPDEEGGPGDSDDGAEF